MHLAAIHEPLYNQLLSEGWLTQLSELRKIVGSIVAGLGIGVLGGHVYDRAHRPMVNAEVSVLATEIGSRTMELPRGPQGGFVIAINRINPITANDIWIGRIEPAIPGYDIHTIIELAAEQINDLAALGTGYYHENLGPQEELDDTAGQTIEGDIIARITNQPIYITIPIIHTKTSIMVTAQVRLRNVKATVWPGRYRS